MLRCGAASRFVPAQFVHWDEQTLVDVVAQAKGTLVIPYGPVIPPRLLEHFTENKVVILDGDFTSAWTTFDPTVFRNCIARSWTTFGSWDIDASIASIRRITIRKLIAESASGSDGCMRRNCQGDLHDDPAPVFTDPTIVALPIDVTALWTTANRRRPHLSARLAPRPSARFARATNAIFKWESTFPFAQ